MLTKIKKWGNSLAVRLPKKIVDKMRLKEGSWVFLDDSSSDEVVIKKDFSDGKKIRREDVDNYILPSRKKNVSISKNIDKILYGADTR